MGRERGEWSSIPYSIYVFKFHGNDDGFVFPIAQAFYKAPGNLSHPKYRSGRDNRMVEAFNPKASESEAANTKKPLRDLDEI